MEFQSEFLVLFDRLQIRYYGIIIVTAMIIAAVVAARLARRDGRDPDHVWGGLTWAIIPGIIGARLWFILFPPAVLCPPVLQSGQVCQDTAFYLQNFFDLQQGAIAIWSGGLSIFGAVLGGALGAYLYIRVNKLPLAPWLDIAAIALPLGQAIGRWANWVNQELYGTITTLPWGIQIDAANRVPVYVEAGKPTIQSMIDYPTTTLFHPLFLYESLWSLAAFFILLWLFLNRRKRFLPGDFMLLFIMQYSVIRFLLEFLRLEVTTLPGTSINLSQLVTLIAFVVALGIFFYRHQPAVAKRIQENVAKREAEEAQRKAEIEAAKKEEEKRLKAEAKKKKDEEKKAASSTTPQQ